MGNKKSEKNSSPRSSKIVLASELGSTHNSLPPNSRRKISSILAVHVIESIDFYLQVKQAHWNVQGENFKTVHEFFDEIADEAREWGDVLAERIRQLGCEAIGSANAIGQYSTLPTYPHGIRDSRDHIIAITERLAAYAKRIRAAIAQIERLEDADTVDICTEISRSADKLLWMVESHL